MIGATVLREAEQRSRVQHPLIIRRCGVRTRDDRGASRHPAPLPSPPCWGAGPLQEAGVQRGAAAVGLLPLRASGDWGRKEALDFRRFSGVLGGFRRPSEVP